MDIQTLKASLTMKQVAEHYGLTIGRGGMANCPFHNEHTASLKIYSNSFYCFGCNSSGDIIAFVMQMYKVDFKAAMSLLNNDFGLNLEVTKQPCKKAVQAHTRQRTAKQDLEVKLEEQISEMCSEFRLNWQLCKILRKEIQIFMNALTNPKYADHIEIFKDRIFELQEMKAEYNTKYNQLEYYIKYLQFKQKEVKKHC